MLLDIEKLLWQGAEPQEGDVALDLSARDYYGYQVPGPVKLHYSAAPGAAEVRLDIAADALLEADCARCLSPALQPLHLECTYRLTRQDLQDEFPQLPLLPGGKLDVDELVYGEIVMEAPGAILCREDCEGLCQRCGKLAAECTCPPEDEGDPRLQILKTLLTNDDQAD